MTLKSSTKGKTGQMLIQRQDHTSVAQALYTTSKLGKYTHTHTDTSSSVSQWITSLPVTRQTEVCASHKVQGLH